MSIENEIKRIEKAKTDIRAVAAEKGVTIPENTSISEYATYLANISTGSKEMSWEEISEISKAGKAPYFFHIGQEKKITLSTGEEATAVILDFNHDDLADGSGKAGITFGLKNCLKTSYPMNATASNSGSWDRSAMRTSTMPLLKSYLESDLQAVIRTVNKKTGDYESSTPTVSSDDLFLFSLMEVLGSGYARTNQNMPTSAQIEEGYQYAYYKGKLWVSTVKRAFVTAFGLTINNTGGYCYQEDAPKGLGDDATAAFNWWLRSPRKDEGTMFVGINYAGGAYTDLTANLNWGVCFGFCV